MHNTTEIEDDEIYESIYMQVVELVEKDNISCGFYKDTANKLKDLYNITKRSDSIAENKGQQIKKSVAAKARAHAKIVAPFFTPTLEAYKLRAKNSYQAGWDDSEKQSSFEAFAIESIKENERIHQQIGDVGKPEELQEEERLRAALEKISTMQLNSPSEAEGRFYDCIDIAEEALNKK